MTATAQLPNGITPLDIINELSINVEDLTAHRNTVRVRGVSQAQLQSAIDAVQSGDVLQRRKDEKTGSVEIHAYDLFDKIEKKSARYHPLETTEWQALRVEAEAYIADPAPNDANYPLLTADSRPNAVLANIVINKRDALRGPKQAIINARTAHKDAIEALTTVADIEAYDITTGWPNI